MNQQAADKAIFRFPDNVFRYGEPATLKQGGWQSASEFCVLLENSWRSQFADYIGEELAQEYIDHLRRVDKLYDFDDAYTIQAYIDDRIVGIGSLMPLAGINLISTLEVHPSFRGSGIGTQLLQALSGASERLMAHVSIHRPRTRKFYARFGFHQLRRERVQHGCHNLEFDVMAMSCGLSTKDADRAIHV